MASNLITMASNLITMASNLPAMASNLMARNQQKKDSKRCKKGCSVGPFRRGASAIDP